jgi:hypothetical protein
VCFIEDPSGLYTIQPHQANSADIFHLEIDVKTFGERSRTVGRRLDRQLAPHRDTRSQL